MKTKNLIKYVLASVAIVLLFTACRKKDDRIAIDSDTSGAIDNNLAQNTSNDVSNISDQGTAGGLISYSSVNNGSEERGVLSDCATITPISNGTTHSVTISFGQMNCMSHDGRNRRGSIKIEFPGQGNILEDYKDSLSVHTITFFQYYVNDNRVEGTYTITNKGRINGHLNYAINVVGGKITKANGGVIYWESSRTREWIEGEGTPAFDDDVYLISGNASGTHSNGNSFSETASNLKIAIGCPYIKSGILQLTPSGKPVRTIDFGNGICDANATVTISGHVFNIVL